MLLLLQKVRLTYIFMMLTVFYLLIAYFIDGVELDRPALTLFSVNSFLYGFYISPIINYQRTRIRDLHKLISHEAAKLYEVAQYSKRLEKEHRSKVHAGVKSYTKAAYVRRDEQGEKEFEKLMKTLISYDGGSDAYKEMLKSAFAVQGNRADIKRLLTTQVYKNEWIVMSILFTITIIFILSIQLPDGSFLNLVPPILCSGLSMLIVILAKMSTLTHKRAQHIWDPLDQIAQSDFEDINGN